LKHKKSQYYLLQVLTDGDFANSVFAAAAAFGAAAFGAAVFLGAVAMCFFLAFDVVTALAHHVYSVATVLPHQQ
jgi:hypothetical protein